MQDMSLHILDIAENSIRASANKVDIRLIEDKSKSILILEIQDNGKGIVGEEINPNRKSYGMSITEKRLSHLNKSDKSEVSINSDQSGTAVNISIRPLNLS